MRDATAAFNVPAIELVDWEADDLIAAYAKAAVAAGGQVTIVSSDKDLMQLIRPGVIMQDPIKQKPIGPDEVREKFGCGPEAMIDLLALMGDSVDNVPGVPGIGPKTACQLLSEFGDLEGVLAAAPAMKPSKRRDLLITHADQARLSRELVVLRDDAPMPQPLDTLVLREPDRAALAAWLHAHGVPLHRDPAGPGWPGGGGHCRHRPARRSVVQFGPYGRGRRLARRCRRCWMRRGPGGQCWRCTRRSTAGLGWAGAGNGAGPGAYLPLGHQGDLDRPVHQVGLATDALAALGPGAGRPVAC